MRSIRDVMCADVDVLRTTDTVADAACFLARRDEDAATLCQADGSLAGTVSAHDIVAQVVARGRDPRRVTLAEFAGVPDGRTAASDATVALDIDVPLEDALALMCRHRRSRLPVVEQTRVVGFVSQRDAARSISFQPPWSDG
jgi:CBS domain-containing protein